jgi:hypothetical protein
LKLSFPPTPLQKLIGMLLQQHLPLSSLLESREEYELVYKESCIEVNSCIFQFFLQFLWICSSTEIVY